MLRLLLAHHAFIDAQSPNGTTPLMMAAAYGSPEAVKLLIEEGADIDMRNQKHMTAMDFARDAERRDAVSLLTQAAQYKAQARPRQAPAAGAVPAVVPPALSSPVPPAAPPAAPAPLPPVRGQW
ncbi:MAG: ankyrin repeat domain-containing protein [Pseudomonadota bacterium]|nr:ankyrin repeat domain-containing protein [Pseudomonadota bacterium]